MNTFNDFIPVLPEILVAIMVIVVMMADLFLSEKYKNIAYTLSQLTLVTLAVLGWLYFNRENQYAFGSQFYIDNMTIVLKGFVYLATFFVFIYSRVYIEEHKIPKGEFYVLALLSMLGAMVLISADSLITIYIGLELHSLPLYAMIAMRRKYYPGAEAAVKYFILGAVMSAFLLYGMSFIYGVTGHLDIESIAQYLSTPNEYRMVVLFAMIFFIVVSAFKLGAAPFHQWVPDVYVGSPNMTTAFLATVPKLAAYGMLVTLLTKALPAFSVQWSEVLMVLAIISIFIGNIVALVQKNLKRMFAYSTVSHIGFIFLGLSMVDTLGYAAAMYYVVVYVVMSVGGFGIILLLSQNGKEVQNIDDLSGLNARNSWLAFMMLILMFSMAGVPPFAGFTSKLLVLNSLVQQGHYALTVYVLVMSVIGSFYYLRVIKVMYFDKGKDDDKKIVVHRDGMAAITVNCLLVLLFGVFPVYLTTVINIIY